MCPRNDYNQGEADDRADPFLHVRILDLLIKNSHSHTKEQQYNVNNIRPHRAGSNAEALLRPTASPIPFAFIPGASKL